MRYPVLFGKGDSQYPGMLAVDDIGPNEAVVKVPSKLIINTKVCYFEPALQQVYYENPDIFARHLNDGDDNLFNSYILYHLSIGERSKHYEQFLCWPQPDETDILMNWDDEDLAYL